MIEAKPAPSCEMAGVIWESVKDDPRLPPGYGVDNLQQHIASWETMGLFAAGDPVGAICLNGNIMHTSILPRWQRRWICDRIMHQVITWALSRHDPLITLVPDGNEQAAQLAEFVGFVQIGRRGEDRLYQMTQYTRKV